MPDSGFAISAFPPWAALVRAAGQNRLTRSPISEPGAPRKTQFMRPGLQPRAQQLPKDSVPATGSKMSHFIGRIDQAESRMAESRTAESRMAGAWMAGAWFGA